MRKHRAKDHERVGDRGGALYEEHPNTRYLHIHEDEPLDELLAGWWGAQGESKAIIG